MNLQRTLGSALQYFFVGLMAFISVFPFIWMMIGAVALARIAARRRNAGPA